MVTFVSLQWALHRSREADLLVVVAGVKTIESKDRPNLVLDPADAPCMHLLPPVPAFMMFLSMKDSSADECSFLFCFFDFNIWWIDGLKQDWSCLCSRSTDCQCQGRTDQGGQRGKAHHCILVNAAKWIWNCCLARGKRAAVIFSISISWTLSQGSLDLGNHVTALSVSLRNDLKLS